MHIFVTKRVDDPSDTRPYPHVIRQWYEGDRLYINSMSSQEAEAAGHGRLLYCIRDILSERHESSLLESLPLRPNYVCIHHGFLDKTGTLPVVLVLKKENIDRAITFTPTNSGLTYVSLLSMTPKFVEFPIQFAPANRADSSVGKWTVREGFAVSP